MSLDAIVNLRQIRMEPEDYTGQDGLIYCGRCGTPRQYVMTAQGYKGTVVPCLCKCRTAERDLQERKRLEREQKEKLAGRKGAAFGTAQIDDKTFANDDGSNPRATELARKYVDTFSSMQENGKGLLFYGPTGTGKTFAAMCIVNSLLVMGRKVMATSFTRLEREMFKETDRNRFVDKLNRFDLILFDDLGAERSTDYLDEIIFDVIDSRYQAKKPILVTTNLSERELKNPAMIGKRRIYSRLQEMCYWIPVTGEDKRAQRSQQT